MSSKISSFNLSNDIVIYDSKDLSQNINTNPNLDELFNS